MTTDPQHTPPAPAPGHPSPAGRIEGYPRRPRRPRGWALPRRRRARAARAPLLLAAGLALLATAVPTTAVAEGPSVGVRPLPSEVLAGFEGPEAPWLAGHRGVDLRATPGAPVRAPAEGIVSFVGTVVDRPVLSLRLAPIGSRDVLSSFEPLVPAVRPGQRVHAGQVVGWAGHGGHCDSRCVHWGVRIAGTYVDPLGWFAASVRLLPTDPRPIDLPPAQPAPTSHPLDDTVLDAVVQVVAGREASGGAAPAAAPTRAGQALGCAWRNAARSRSVVTCV